MAEKKLHVMWLKKLTALAGDKNIQIIVNAVRLHMCYSARHQCGEESVLK